MNTCSRPFRRAAPLALVVFFLGYPSAEANIRARASGGPARVKRRAFAGDSTATRTSPRTPRRTTLLRKPRTAKPKSSDKLARQQLRALKESARTRAPKLAKKWRNNKRDLLANTVAWGGAYAAMFGLPYAASSNEGVKMMIAVAATTIATFGLRALNRAFDRAKKSLVTTAWANDQLHDQVRASPELVKSANAYELIDRAGNVRTRN